MKTASEWQSEFEDWWQAHGDESDGSHDLGHFRRVYKLSLEIAQGEGGMADPLILLAGAYFHDVVNPPKDSPLRSQASQLSADKAAEILTDMNFPADKIAPVGHVIAAHSFSAGIPTETIEARILQDADRMEALGALGIARNMYVSGLMGSKLFHADDPLAKNRMLDDRKYALDHFELKLLKLPAMMQTATGRRIAESRAEFLRVFRTQLLSEVEI
ncbi:MAG: HD domain-containing protein [Pseudomonadota bacterium]